MADRVTLRCSFSAAYLQVTGKLKGKKPKLTARQQADAPIVSSMRSMLVRMRSSGEYSIADLMEMFSVGRATVYRVLERAGHNRVGEAT